MSFFKQKKAVIVETNKATGKVNVTDDIGSIAQANMISSKIINSMNGVVIGKEENEFEGNETDFVAPTSKQGVWHEYSHWVMPNDLKE